MLLFVLFSEKDIVTAVKDKAVGKGDDVACFVAEGERGAWREAQDRADGGEAGRGRRGGVEDERLGAHDCLGVDTVAKIQVDADGDCCCCCCCCAC